MSAQTFTAALSGEIRAELAQRKLTIADLAPRVYRTPRDTKRVLSQPGRPVWFRRWWRDRPALDLDDLEGMCEWLGLDPGELVRRAMRATANV